MDRLRCRLIVLAAGLGQRFKQEGYIDPKPYVDVAGIRMLDLVVRNVRACLKADIRALLVTHQSMGKIPFQIENVDMMQLPAAIGAAPTARLALEKVDDDELVIISNCDQVVLFDGPELLSNLKKKSCRGAIVTFEDSTLNPKWSYAEVDDKGRILRVAEKKPISTHATVGIYAYHSKKIAIDAIDAMVAADDRTNGEFYLCPAYNYVKGKIIDIKSQRMWGLGTPEDLETALADKEFLESIDKLR